MNTEKEYVITPTKEQIADMMNHPDPGPFVMINLLRFKSNDGSSGAGRRAYKRYMIKASPLVKEAGGRMLWMGEVNQTFIGTPDDNWDLALLVEYPSRAAFLKMIERPEYAEIHKDREAGIEHSLLLPCSTQFSRMKDG